MASPGLAFESAAEPDVRLDADNLEAIYRAQSAFVRRNARRLGCDDDWADDVVHEVFLVVARRLGEFRQEASIRTWLFAITYRAVQRMARDRARYGRRRRDFALAEASRLPAEPAARSEAGQYLRVLLGRLDEAKRVVFILAELEGMTSVEIGQLLGLKPPTVDSRLRAARTALGRMIARERVRERSQP
jgi:RNA polymerase sigma-70 factor (ECF subfamily)